MTEFAVSEEYHPIGRNKKNHCHTRNTQRYCVKLSVDDFEDRYLFDDDVTTAEPLDINKDGKIDVAEYGANIIAADVLGKGTTDPFKADGTINTNGLNAVLEYTKKSNAAAAAKLYSNIYNAYQLGANLNQI